MKPRLKGECYVYRYLDDFVVCFEHKRDAERFAPALPERLGKFGLELERSKTGLVPFGKFMKREAECLGHRKRPTLKFLGFTLYGMRYPWGYWGVGLKPQASRLSRFLPTLKEVMRRIRPPCRSKTNLTTSISDYEDLPTTLDTHLQLISSGGPPVVLSDVVKDTELSQSIWEGELGKDEYHLNPFPTR